MRYFKIIILYIFTIVAIACQAQTQKNALFPNEFEQKLATTPNAVLIDVRTAKEYADGHIKNALNVDYNSSQDWVKALKEWDKTKTYFLYCRSGKRSEAAKNSMINAGFSNVYDLQGGILAWEKVNKTISKN